MSYVIACLVCLVVGAVAGFLVDWSERRQLRETVRLQAEALHTDDRTPRHPFTAAGPDDHDARSRVARRSS